jgi:hypothetical protein
MKNGFDVIIAGSGAGGVNPYLTVMALAERVEEAVAGRKAEGASVSGQKP